MTRMSQVEISNFEIFGARQGGGGGQRLFLQCEKNGFGERRLPQILNCFEYRLFETILARGN